MEMHVCWREHGFKKEMRRYLWSRGQSDGYFTCKSKTKKRKKRSEKWDIYIVVEFYDRTSFIYITPQDVETKSLKIKNKYKSGKKN